MGLTDAELQTAVLDFIANSPKQVDSVDIVHHFKLRADITLKAVGQLEATCQLKRIQCGLRAHYEVL